MSTDKNNNDKHFFNDHIDLIWLHTEWLSLFISYNQNQRPHMNTVD